MDCSYDVYTLNVLFCGVNQKNIKKVPHSDDKPKQHLNLFKNKY